MKKDTISYGHGEVNKDSISSSSPEVAMDEFTYTGKNGTKITLIYDSTVNDDEVVKDLKSLMVSMVVKQVRNTEEVSR